MCFRCVCVVHCNFEWYTPLNFWLATSFSVGMERKSTQDEVRCNLLIGKKFIQLQYIDRKRLFICFVEARPADKELSTLKCEVATVNHGSYSTTVAGVVHCVGWEQGNSTSRRPPKDSGRASSSFARIVDIINISQIPTGQVL